MRAVKQEIQLERVAKYLEGQADVAAAYLFGSFARERARSDSDVDVAVLFAKREQDQMARFERCLEIEIGLQAIVRRTVQVIDLEDSSLLLQRQVRKYGRLLMEKDARRRAAFEVASRRLFLELERVRRLRQAVVLADLGGGPAW